MKNLSNIVQENRQEVIELMTEKNQTVVSFDTVNESDIPYIVIDDGIGEFIQIDITAAKLFEVDGKKYIDFYSSDLEWIDEDDALFFTDNNVYQTMYNILSSM